MSAPSDVSGLPGRVDVWAVGEPLAAFSLVGRGAEARALCCLAGAELNVMVGAARLGLASAIVGRVGQDALGGWVESQLRGEGVATGAIRIDSERPTGFFYKHVDADGEPTRRYCRHGSAGSAMDESDISEQLAARGRALVISGLTTLLSSASWKAALRAARLARDAGATVLVDLNLRPGLPGSADSVQRVGSLAALASVVLGTPREYARLLQTSTGSPRWLAQQAARRWPDTDITIHDADSAGYLARGQWVSVGTTHCPVVDASGAGDAFTAGVITGVLGGASTREALALGNRCACLQVQTHGDCDGIPRGMA